MILLFTLVSSIGGLRSTSADDYERLVGEWTIESFSFAGYELRGTEKNPMTLSISKSKLSFTPEIDYKWQFQFNASSLFNMNKKSSVSFNFSDEKIKRTYRLTENTNPAQIDIEIPTPKGKEKTFGKAIYRFVDDRLEICMGDPSTRPTEFDASGRNYLMRLTKISPQSTHKVRN
jgi:uncharacterized protein (TIGR03067 family)